ncbi:MAG: amino acid ABC transporter substrate-binding protein [Halorientalis sp.]
MPPEFGKRMHSTANRRQVLRAGGIATAAGLAGCFGGGGGKGGNEIKLGCSISLSGQFANAGKNIRKGQDFMVEQINSQGGIDVGGSKRKLKIKYYDDKSQPSTSASRTQQLITQDQTDLILGPVTSSVTYATLPIVKNQGAVMVQGYGIATKIFEEYGSDGYTFCTIVSAGDTPVSSLKAFTNPDVTDPPIESIAMFSDKGTYPQSLRKAITGPLADKFGYDVRVDENVEGGVKDLSPVINKAKKSDADLFIMNTHAATGQLATNQMSSLKYSPKAVWASFGGFTTTDYHDALGKRSRYQTGFAQYSPNWEYDDPFFGSNQKFASAYKKKFGSDPAFTQADGANIVETMALAIEQAGSTDVEKVRSALGSLDAETLFGPVKFDGKGRIQKSTGLLQRQGADGSDITIVAPEKLKVNADAKLAYPMPAWSDR